MDWLINAGALFAAFFAMEGVAWFTHKYVMHGLLWALHKDHHVKDSTRFFERNDFFFVLFALPGITLIMIGFEGFTLPFWFGAGITLYGSVYFLIHDVFIHRRFEFLKKIDHPYFRAIRKAHYTHHRHKTKEDGECFGMLVAPSKYFKDESRG